MQRRRDLIRPDLNDNYQQLCSEHIEFTSWVFGDDLPKQVQDISATNRASQQLSGTQNARQSPGPFYSRNANPARAHSYQHQNFHQGPRRQKPPYKGKRKNFPKNYQKGWLPEELPAKNVNCTKINMVSQTVKPSFVVGRIKNFIQNWEDLTTDSFILNIVAGCKIDLQKMPVQHTAPRETKFSAKEWHFVNIEIRKLLDKQVIIPSQHEADQFISTIFLTPKKDGSFRLILNLKKFNMFVRYQHFKLESLKQVVAMMKPGCFMASLDIRDAYYSVPIHKSHKNTLNFSSMGNFISLLVCQMGLHVHRDYLPNY